MFVIALYEIDMAFGGPEEGGWWYQTGELKRIIGTSHDEDRAWAKAQRCNTLLDHLQRHVRPVSSAAYRGGRYRATVYVDIPPLQYPQARPHYE